MKSTTSIKLSSRTNTPILRSAPDNTSYNAHCMACEEISQASDVEATVMSSEIERSEDDELQLISKIDKVKDNIPQLIRDGNDASIASTDEGELLRWHYCLGHLA